MFEMMMLEVKRFPFFPFSRRFRMASLAATSEMHDASALPKSLWLPDSFAKRNFRKLLLCLVLGVQCSVFNRRSQSRKCGNNAWHAEYTYQYYRWSR
jgi:hypothetical protein